VTTTGGVGTITVVSDRRKKREIEYFADSKNGPSLPKILGLKPCKFKRDPSDTSVYEGFIAQDVEQFIPHAVDGKKYEYELVRNAEGEVVLDDKGEPVLDYTRIRPRGLDHASLIAHTVQALQEMDTEKVALEARVAALEATVQSMTSRLLSLGV